MRAWRTLRNLLIGLLVSSAALFAIGVAVERSQPAHSAAREATERAATTTTPEAPTRSGTTPETSNEGAATTTSTQAPTETAGGGGTEAHPTSETPAHKAKEGGTESTPATETHAATPAPTETTATEPTGGETPTEAATTAAPVPAHTASHTEVHSERVFGINPESIGLVIAAVVGSLLLAFAVWRFPRLRPLLAMIVLVCLVFGVFDIREAFHQASESRTGLTITATFVAALHLVAAAVAGLLMRASTTDDHAPLEAAM